MIDGKSVTDWKQSTARGAAARSAIGRVLGSPLTSNKRAFLLRKALLASIEMNYMSNAPAGEARAFFRMEKV